MPTSSAPVRTGLKYLETAAPLYFPEQEKVPESPQHQELRAVIDDLLKRAFQPQATVGSDQFVYLDAADPKQCLAPDAFVRLAPSHDLSPSWKIWERGAPEVAVEIISRSDSGTLPWQRKFQRYQRLGVLELLRFAPDESQRPLRIWDRVDGVLLEREVTMAPAPSLVLDLHWVVAPVGEHPLALRIASGERGDVLIPTVHEALAAETEARGAAETARAIAETAQAIAETAQASAEARIAELEAELAAQS